MPYLDYVMGPYDETWDLARMEKNDYLHRIVQDYDSAYYYFQLCGKVRRDPVGSLAYDTYEMYRPNGMAAKAFKSRALLYAASPLNNKNGIADWQEAAAAAWDAIQVAEANGVILLPLKEAAGNDRHLKLLWQGCMCREYLDKKYGNTDMGLGRRQRSSCYDVGRPFNGTHLGFRHKSDTELC